MSDMKLIMESWRQFNEEEGEPTIEEPQVQTVGQLRQLFKMMKLNNFSKLFEDENDEFEIFTNYMDSHIYFTSDIVQNEFEKF